MKQTLDYFSYQSSVYDEYQVNCIPKYTELTNVAVDFLTCAFDEGDPLSLLDLGCGTGNTTMKLRARFPAAAIMCLDGSEHMLTLARDKLAATGSAQVDYHLADLNDPHWSTCLSSRSFDGIISVLVLEHLPFDAYRHCIAQVLGMLKPGGWFVTVEGYGGPLLQGLFQKEMRQREATFVAQGKMSQAHMDEMKTLSAANEKHYFSTMRERENWWLDCGFSSVSFIWQYYCVAVLVGQKTIR